MDRKSTSNHNPKQLPRSRLILHLLHAPWGSTLFYFYLPWVTFLFESGQRLRVKSFPHWPHGACWHKWCTWRRAVKSAVLVRGYLPYYVKPISSPSTTDTTHSTNFLRGLVLLPWTFRRDLLPNEFSTSIFTASLQTFPLWSINIIFLFNKSSCQTWRCPSYAATGNLFLKFLHVRHTTYLITTAIDTTTNQERN